MTSSLALPATCSVALHGPAPQLQGSGVVIQGNSSSAPFISQHGSTHQGTLTIKDVTIQGFVAGAMTLNKETICKTPLHRHVDVRDKSSNTALRISLKSEDPVKNVPVCVSSTHVRIKQKRRFLSLDKVWAYDFSMTWSGKNKTDAEASQMKEEAQDR